MMAIDKTTRRWTRNAGDERAARGGARFEQARADHACEFFPKFLRLYEGERAGKPFELMPWQADILSRVFGWVRPSEFFGRLVRRFRKAGIWLPKKSGKSPFAAGVGLYLLLADGEMGQKVFSAARDGKQAGIVHTHARKMVEASPELAEVCKVNQSTGRISHIPSSSYYDILAGDNILGQEGLNGSCIIDETHVVDERLASVLEHMGASRSEPLHFEVSTAGNNPLGYGRKQYEYGKAVESGDVADDAFFFAAYEAPQQASDEELDDPAVWKKANPSWGITINEEEFRSSLERARAKGLTDWTTFKMYRLNVWATSENPWLRIDDWQNCRDEFTEADLEGRECAAGLDLAKTRDLTSLVLVFDQFDETYRLLPYFWLPEERLKELSTIVPQFAAWARDGFVRVTPGDVCDYAFVKRDIADLSRKFRIRELAYDPYNAEQLTQQLEQGQVVDGKVLEQGIGLTRFAFAQTIVNYAAPTSEFERLVVAGKMQHNGHPVLTWQAGHVKCRTDSNNNKRPVKQKPGDHRTVDGMVAAIMGLSRLMQPDTQRSVYDVENRSFVEIG